MTIGDFLRRTTARLANAGSTSPRLDALLLLADAHDKTTAWVLAHPEFLLEAATKAKLEQQVERRVRHEPMAYIRGKQEFYSRSFRVTPDVLIPRPETETLIDLLRGLGPKTGQTLVDVGTGSGAIAITAALEFPNLSIFACDTSQAALDIAGKNAHSLDAHVTFYHQNLLQHEQHGPFDFIVANLPYVDPSWPRSPETQYEPAVALFAADSGLALIKKLLSQCPDYLAPGGFILLEADPRQHPAIQAHAKTYGLTTLRAQVFGMILRNPS